MAYRCVFHTGTICLAASCCLGGTLFAFYFCCLQLDLPLSRAFFKWMLGHEQSLGPDDLHHVDPAVARTFVKLQEILQQKKRIDGDKSHVGHSIILLPLCLM